MVSGSWRDSCFTDMQNTSSRGCNERNVAQSSHREVIALNGTISQESGLLDLYFHGVADSKPLTTEEELTLAERIAVGDEEARNELFAANLRFVIKVVAEYKSSGVPLEDLISAGNVGLITAAERFDATRGFRFITYAVWRIRQSISQVQSQCSRMLRLPSNRIKLLSSIIRGTGARYHDEGTRRLVCGCSVPGRRRPGSLSRFVGHLARSTGCLG